MNSNFKDKDLLKKVLFSSVFSLLIVFINRYFFPEMPVKASLYSFCFISFLSYFFIQLTVPFFVQNNILIKIISVFVFSILLMLPFSELAYYKFYRGFIEESLLASMLQEIWFLVTTASAFLWNNIFSFLIFLIVSFLLSFTVLSFVSKNKIYTRKSLFTNKYYLAIFLIVFFSQVRWALRHNSSIMFLRCSLIVIIFAFLDVLYFYYKQDRKNFFVVLLKSIFLALVFFRPLNILSSDFYTQFYKKTLSTFLFIKKSTDLSMSESTKKLVENVQTELPFNVLIIVNDSLRMQDFNSGTNAEIEWFLKDSISFEKAYSPANYTDTSVPALFTGISANFHPTHYKEQFRLWDYFKADTQTFYIATQDNRWAKLDKFMKSPGLDFLWSTLEDDPDSVNVNYVDDLPSQQKTIEFLNEHKGQRFLGVWHTDVAHFPYFQNENFEFNKPCDLYISKGWPKTLHNCYLNSVHYLSHLMSELLNKVDLENTVVILTADHGENFGEHGVFFHNKDLHQHAIRVPFVWHIPEKIKKQIPSKKWEVFNENKNKVASLYDLVPTLIDLVGMISNKKPEVPESFVYSGSSLFESNKYRALFSTGCFIDYRCHNRDIAFLNNDFHVILGVDKMQIYKQTDFEQKESLKVEQLNQEDWNLFLYQVKDIHPMTRFLSK